MVLVTGGTGLVGSHLLLHLIENGESVRAIYRKLETIQKTQHLFSHYKKENLFEKIDWLQADILDVPSLEIAFENIKYVYHCAAFISFDPKDEAIIRKTNIEGTANIVNFCIAKNVQKLCFISSIAALGDLKENEKIITEETEWNPEKSHSDYAISKFGAEMEIWRGQQEGLDSVIVNPGVILGPRIWEEGSGIFFKKIETGFPFYTKGTTGFIAVPDVIKIMVQLMKSEVKNERFALVANTISYQELFNAMADALKTKKPSVYINPFLICILWRIDWFFSTFFRTKRILDKETAIASYSKNLYSNEKIKNALQLDFLDIQQYIEDNSSL
ncbi:NAD-dependent epimerase/dehydratase family protein [Flavobacterium franklandianum]|uniref:NAD-dependent epimerase/dehydratase family protein n=1 Tax=Flavobacterium franklandianum TaxID=2594430 RepID=A0A553CLF1_9FLAO|nr:NAD-dependent epimerase/dehydratase family protein [Flavobacterium franklandianum]TRX21225.1 NAD-dependent epimerase/dehydratase family protein [Flavobacterium franklandianum]